MHLKNFFSKTKQKIKGKGNIIELPKKNNYKGKIKIIGDYNKIEIADNVKYYDLNIVIYGNHNNIRIDEYCELNEACFSIGIKYTPANNVCINLGTGISISGKSHLFCAEDDSKIIINENCLLSSGIDIWCTDTHSIHDINGNILNMGKEVIIGKHVWIGKDVKICKNTKIADNCVIGWNSVITSSISNKHNANSVIAGNPAKVVKENILWSKERPNIKHIEC